MSEVTKKSDTSSSQMRLLVGTPHIYFSFKVWKIIGLDPLPLSLEVSPSFKTIFMTDFKQL